MFARTAIVFLIFNTVVILVADAEAQSSSVATQLQRMRRDIDTLQGYIFRKDTGSEKVRAGRSIPDLASQESVSQIQLQIQNLRRQMREMNGQFEEIQFEIIKTAKRLDLLIEDVDLRLQAIEERSETDPMLSSVSESGDGKVKNSKSGQKAETPGKNSFGVMKKQELSRFREVGHMSTSKESPSSTTSVVDSPSKVSEPNKPTASPVTTVVEPVKATIKGKDILPKGTPKEQYDFAYGLLMRRELKKAELALMLFLDKHPEHELADNATFWLGETFYARKNFERAIEIYYDAYKKFPKGNKAPAVLLKLGMALATIGEKTSACSAYDVLANSHPKANPRILGNAERAKKSLGCN